MRTAYLLLALTLAAAAAPDRTVDVPGLNVQAAEGSRSLLDAFPYLEGVRPETVKWPADPFAAVRVFAAGPLVQSKEQAGRIVEAGKKLQKELKLFRIEIDEQRDPSYEPRVDLLHNGDCNVSFVAFEMDRVLQLVHVRAVVRKGKMEIHRHPIVQGPPTSWQTAGDVDERQEQAMRAEVERARKAFYAALQPTRDLDTFWAVSRIFTTFEEYQGFFGAWDETLPTGVLRVVYRLDDGTRVLLEQAPKLRVGRVTHYDADRKKVLHRLRR